MKTVLFGFISTVFLFAACNKERSSTTTAATTGSQGDLAPDTVVATVGDQKITVRELDEKVKMDEVKYNARKQGVDTLVTQKLLDAEAKKRGLPDSQALIKQEVEDKVPAPPPPPEEEIKKFYEANKAQMGGATYEQIKDRVAQHLGSGAQQQVQEQKRAKFREMLTRLREEAGVKVTLPTLRKKVTETGPSRGPADAKVTIIEFSDFQCPFCSRAHGTVEEVMQAYAGKVKLVFRQMPLTQLHPNAFKSAEASLCAHDQGKFWEYHDTLFKNQGALGVDKLKEYATQLGLDASKFNACLDGNTKADAVRADMKDGEGVGVQGTPAFFVNGVFLNGAVPLQDFKEIIDTELKGS